MYCLKFANTGMLMDAFTVFCSFRCVYFDEVIFHCQAYSWLIFLFIYFLKVLVLNLEQSEGASIPPPPKQFIHRKLKFHTSLLISLGKFHEQRQQNAEAKLKCKLKNKQKMVQFSGKSSCFVHPPYKQFAHRQQ